MSEIPTGYVPEKVEPYDPAIAELTKGKEQQIISKAQEIIKSSGVIQLPEGREGPTAFIMRGSTIIQSFSSSENVVFNTVTEVVGKRNDYIQKHIGDEDFNIFYVKATKEGGGPIFLTFLNPVKAAIYQRLLKEKPGTGKDYTADRFQEDEFTKASPEEISILIDKYLDSKLRPDLADKHFIHLTHPKTKLPGGGLVKKLY